MVIGAAPVDPASAHGADRGLPRVHAKRPTSDQGSHGNETRMRAPVCLNVDETRVLRRGLTSLPTRSQLGPHVALWPSANHDRLAIPTRDSGLPVSGAPAPHHA